MNRREFMKLTALSAIGFAGGVVVVKASDRRVDQINDLLDSHLKKQRKGYTKAYADWHPEWHDTETAHASGNDRKGFDPSRDYGSYIYLPTGGTIGGLKQRERWLCRNLQLSVPKQHRQSIIIKLYGPVEHANPLMDSVDILVWKYFGSANIKPNTNLNEIWPTPPIRRSW